MKKVLIAFTLAVAAFPALAGIDDPAKPWSYFVHPVTCIGMPLQTARTGIQVTPEGTVFTGEHELALFLGDERKPLACRQRRRAVARRRGTRATAGHLPCGSGCEVRRVGQTV